MKGDNLGIRVSSVDSSTMNLKKGSDQNHYWSQFLEVGTLKFVIFHLGFDFLVVFFCIHGYFFYNFTDSAPNQPEPYKGKCQEGKPLP